MTINVEHRGIWINTETDLTNLIDKYLMLKSEVDRLAGDLATAFSTLMRITPTGLLKMPKPNYKPILTHINPQEAKP